MNRIVIYADSTAMEPGRQEINEKYYLTDAEMNQLEMQLASLIEGNRIPELAKVKKEGVLLSDNIEERINLNSKGNLITIGRKNYYLEYSIRTGDERDKMTDMEVKEFMKLERMIKNVAQPIQKIYRQKHKKYGQLFNSL